MENFNNTSLEENSNLNQPKRVVNRKLVWFMVGFLILAILAVFIPRQIEKYNQQKRADYINEIVQKYIPNQFLLGNINLELFESQQISQDQNLSKEPLLDGVSFVVDNSSFSGATSKMVDAVRQAEWMAVSIYENKENKFVFKAQNAENKEKSLAIILEVQEKTNVKVIILPFNNQPQ